MKFPKIPNSFYETITMKPWATPTNVKNFSLASTLFLFLATLFMMMFVIWNGGSIASIWSNYTTLVYLLFMITFVAIMQFQKQDEYYASIGSPTAAILGSLAAFIIGGLLLAKFAIQGFSTPDLTSITLDPTLAMAYIIVVIPLVEEKFFGRTVPFILQPFFKNGWLTLAVTCLIFAGFHIWTDGAATNAWGMFGYNICFRAFCNIGNEKLKTSAFGNIFHYINNITAIFRGG